MLLARYSICSYQSRNGFRLWGDMSWDPKVEIRKGSCGGQVCSGVHPDCSHGNYLLNIKEFLLLYDLLLYPILKEVSHLIIQPLQNSRSDFFVIDMALPSQMCKQAVVDQHCNNTKWSNCSQPKEVISFILFAISILRFLHSNNILVERNTSQ